MVRVDVDGQICHFCSQEFVTRNPKCYQNFGNASGEDCVHDLRVCPKKLNRNQILGMDALENSLLNLVGTEL